MKVNWDSFLLLMMAVMLLNTMRDKFGTPISIHFLLCFGTGFFWHGIYRPVFEWERD